MFITDYINDESLKLNVYGLVIHNEFSVSSYNSNQGVDYILKVIKKIEEAKKIPFVLMDKIIHEDEVDKVNFYLNEIKKTSALIIYSDYMFLYNHDNLMERLIYYPKTLVCNEMEAEAIDTDLFVSNEISFEEIKKINDHVNNKKLGLKVFGYLSIFYTKRDLLRLYNDFENDNKFLKNHIYDLKEETRNDKYKIYEGSFGTIIYTPFIYILKDEIKLLNNFEYFYIDTQLLPFDKIKTCIDLYTSFKFDELNKEFDNLESGFLDKKSILIKDKANE